MLKRAVQLWAILVDTSLGVALAQDLSLGYSPARASEFSYVLCDSLHLAEAVRQGGEFVPKNATARVVPVVVEIREISSGEAQEWAERALQTEERIRKSMEENRGSS